MAGLSHSVYAWQCYPTGILIYAADFVSSMLYHVRADRVMKRGLSRNSIHAHNTHPPPLGGSKILYRSASAFYNITFHRPHSYFSHLRSFVICLCDKSH